MDIKPEMIKELDVQEATVSIKTESEDEDISMGDIKTERDVDIENQINKILGTTIKEEFDDICETKVKKEACEVKEEPSSDEDDESLPEIKTEELMLKSESEDDNSETGYEVMIKSKSDKLNELRRRQLELCQYFGKKPKIIQDEPLPSLKELNRFQKHVEKLENERFNRMETFYNVKQAILNIIAELKYKPSTKFEQSVVNSDKFKVSNKNMELLSHFLKNLEGQLKDVKEEIVHLWHKLVNIWNFLDIPYLDRYFRQANKDTSIALLEASRKELARCEDLKKANIKTYITKLGNELDVLWKKCHCKKEEVLEKFGSYASNHYTEDVLELYEVEVEKWKRYYKENKEMIQLLNKHNVLWLKMKQLEERFQNPSRFNNRGGQFSKEEKTRHLLAKKLSSIEKNLVYMAKKYELCLGVPFKTFGLTVLEHFENLHINREHAKNEKSSVRKLQNTQTTITCAESVAKLFPSTSTINAGTPKRKTPCTPNDKHKRIKLTQKEVSTVPKQRLPKSKRPGSNLEN